MTESALADVAAVVRRHFARPLTLPASVWHYVDSTLSHPSPAELAAALADEDHPEHGPLLELICFPDLAFQTAIEPLVQASAVAERDLAGLAERLRDADARIRIRLRDAAATIAAPMPEWAMARFLERLRLTRRIAPRLSDAFSAVSPNDRGIRFAVRLRNSRMVQDERRVRFLCNLLRRMPDIGEADFTATLAFLESLPGRGSVYAALAAVKRRCLRALHEAERLADAMKTLPMEMLMLQGARAAAVDVEATRREIRWADAVSLAVFGKVWAVETETPLTRQVDDLRAADLPF